VGLGVRRRRWRGWEKDFRVIILVGDCVWEWCGVVDAARMESWDSKINICGQPYNKALGFTDFHQIKV